MTFSATASGVRGAGQGKSGWRMSSRMRASPCAANLQILKRISGTSLEKGGKSVSGLLGIVSISRVCGRHVFGLAGGGKGDVGIKML